ncbi:hypothetical protein Tco_0583482 [Tanacetum coccineum]
MHNNIMQLRVQKIVPPMLGPEDIHKWRSQFSTNNSRQTKSSATYWIQCFNYKGYGPQCAKEYRKPKRVTDYGYHQKQEMMSANKLNKIPLQAEPADWLEDTDEESVEPEIGSTLQPTWQRFRSLT